MNFPSLTGLSLLPGLGKNGIAVSPRWTCEHAIIIECSLADLSCDDEDDDGSGEFEVVFEPDFSLDDEDGDGLVGLGDHEDDDDEEDDWPR